MLQCHCLLVNCTIIELAQWLAIIDHLELILRYTAFEKNTSVKFTDPFGLLLKILLIILLNFACFLCYCCGVVVADAILSVAHAVFEGCLSLWFLLC